MSDKLLQNIFCSQEKYLDSIPQALKNRKAIYAIQNCRTENMGTSVYSCKDNHTPIKQHHSCRHRSCYICAQKSRLQWIESQRKRLFDVPHFHVVFTLPHEYLTLWQYNEALFTKILFKASQKTLMELIGDDKHHDVTPGILMALHTWGRQLDLHPHTHCLVTAGGLNAKAEWQSIDKFLLPSEVIKRFYRGTLQSLLRDAFAANELILPPSINEGAFWQLYRAAYAKSWCVRIEDKYDHGKGVMLYLSRYLKGGPVNPKQIREVSNDAVVFNYLDHRDKHVKPLRLKMEEFLRRVLMHVPAMGKHTVRFYGLYATCSKQRHTRCVSELGDLTKVRGIPGLTLQDMVLFCSKCGARARLNYRLWNRHQKGNSINKEKSGRGCAGGHVQQNDEPDNAREGFFSTA